MSKLLEKLERISRGSTQALGFKAATAMTRGPSIVLIAALSEGDTEAATLARQQGADAVLISLAKLEGEGLRQVVGSLAEVPWGVSVKEGTAEELSQLREMGCDFIVFDAAEAPLALLREKEMAKIVEIQPSLKDGPVRAIESMPIDAVLIGAGGDPALSIHRLMTCYHVANLVRKPRVVSVPMDVTEEDLQQLLEAGIAAVVVNMEKGVRDELSRLREAIDALLPSRGRKGKLEPLLPHIGANEAMEFEEEEE